MKKLNLILALALLVASLTIGGCQSKSENPTATPQPTQKQPVEQTQSTSKTIATAPPTSLPPDTPQPESPTTEEPSPVPTKQEPAADPQMPTGALAAKLTGLDLAVFFEVSWRELMLRDPETIVAEGLAQVYPLEGVELTNISDAYIRETYQMYAVILDMLRQYDRQALTSEMQVSFDVYEWYLEDRLREQEFMYYDYPASYFPVTAVHEQVVQFFTDLHPLANKQDARDYVTRLGQVDVKFEQLLEGLKLREDAGVIPPRFALQWGLYGLRDLSSSSARSTPFYSALQQKLDDIPDLGADEKQDLLTSAEQAIEESVLPAYQELQQYLQRLEPAAPSDDGVWQFPQGDDYYAYRLRHYTTVNLSADQIHELGMQELERIHAEMRVIFDELGYPQDESIPELFDRVAQDSEHISGDKVLETYENLISQAEQNLDDVFDIRPQAKVIVVADDFGGYYMPASFDGSRPGAFYAAVGGSGEDYYGMPTLAYHEAIPGHHWQIAIAQETELPSFRRGLSFTGYAEGWALYAEHLAWELGWYDDDPYGNLGRLQAEVFRAARLVVDTGIHAKGWDFDQALDFFIENVGFDRGDIVNPEHQIARYVVWPGQSAAYKVGMIKMLELRQRAMDQLGDQFDLKEFHRVVLSNGSMPLEVLERVVDDYIEAKLN